MHAIQTWLTTITDALFPIRCAGCFNLCRRNELPYLCTACFKEFPVRSSFECIGCKVRTPLGITCISCRPEWQVDRLLIASDYSHTPAGRLIAALKFRFARPAAITIGALLRRYVNRTGLYKKGIFSDKLLIIPVPSGSRRLRWRGFNQAELITEKCFSGLHLPLSKAALRKSHNTGFQSHLKTRQERLLAVKNIFTVNDAAAVQGRNIILIDDICTTGATLNACADTLKQSGAASVSALVFARDSYTSKELFI